MVKESTRCGKTGQAYRRGVIDIRIFQKKSITNKGMSHRRVCITHRDPKGLMRAASRSSISLDITRGLYWGRRACMGKRTWRRSSELMSVTTHQQLHEKYGSEPVRTMSQPSMVTIKPVRTITHCGLRLACGDLLSQPVMSPCWFHSLDVRMACRRSQ